MALVVAIVAIVLLHAVQILAPPVISPDSMSYARIAEAQAAGQGIRPPGLYNRWPPGYPLLLSVLIRLGIASSASFLTLNVLALGGGLAAAARLLRRDWLTPAETTFAMLLTLLSLPVLYAVPVAQSDSVGFGLVLAALLALDRADRAPSGRPFVLAASLGAVLVLLAISVRTVGVTLLPALAWIVVRRADRRWLRPTPLAALSMLLLFTGVALDLWILRTHYLVEAVTKIARRFRWSEHGALYDLASLARSHLVAWGGVALNTMSWRIPWGGRPIAVLAGLGLLALGAVAFRRRGRLDPVAVFVATYTGVLLVHPAYLPIYWLPIAPFVAGAFAALPARAPGAAGRIVVGLYLTVWSLLGAEVLVRRLVSRVRPRPPRAESRPPYPEMEQYRQKYDITRRRPTPTPPSP